VGMASLWQASHLFSPAALNLWRVWVCMVGGTVERWYGGGVWFGDGGGVGGSLAFHVCRRVCEVCLGGWLMRMRC